MVAVSAYQRRRDPERGFGLQPGILQRAERVAHIDQAGWYLVVAELPWFRSDPQASLRSGGTPVLATRSGGHPIHPERSLYP